MKQISIVATEIGLSMSCTPADPIDKNSLTLKNPFYSNRGNLFCMRNQGDYIHAQIFMIFNSALNNK